MSAKLTNAKAAKTTSCRRWIRLVLFYLFIPFILLICGGDLGWRQAWLYSALILVAGIGGRMWAEHRHPGLLAERQDIESIQGAKNWDKVLAPLMAVTVVYPVVVVAGLDHRFSWSAVFPLWLILPGFILIMLGYAFAAWALAENQFFSSVVRIQTDRGHTVWTLIPAVVASIIAVIRTAFEDRTLQEELPGYRDYAQRVRYRLIPWVY